MGGAVCVLGVGVNHLTVLNNPDQQPQRSLGVIGELGAFVQQTPQIAVTVRVGVAGHRAAHLGPRTDKDGQSRRRRIVGVGWGVSGWPGGDGRNRGGGRWYGLPDRGAVQKVRVAMLLLIRFCMRVYKEGGIGVPIRDLGRFGAVGRAACGARYGIGSLIPRTGIVLPQYGLVEPEVGECWCAGWCERRRRKLRGGRGWLGAKLGRQEHPSHKSRPPIAHVIDKDTLDEGFATPVRDDLAHAAIRHGLTRELADNHADCRLALQLGCFAQGSIRDGSFLAVLDAMAEFHQYLEHRGR